MAQRNRQLPSVLSPLARRLSSTDHYVIAIDPPRRHLRMDITGLWNADTATSFGVDMRRAIDALVAAGTPYGAIRTMIDVRHSSIMPQALVEKLQQLAVDHGPGAERIAFLCSSVLQKMQYQRIAPQQMFAYFLEESKAREWLFVD